MRALTVEAKSHQSARELRKALADFSPSLAGDDVAGYRLTIELGSFGRDVIKVLDAIERYVTARNSEAAPVELDGRRYTIHPQ